jgi:hypothetical protein
MKVTEKRMQEIDARVRAATPGPWERFIGDGRGNIDVLDSDFNHRFRATPADLALMGHAREDLPDLLADLREAREALAQVRLLRTQGATRETARALGLLDEFLAHGSLHLTKLVWARAEWALGFVVPEDRTP